MLRSLFPPGREFTINYTWVDVMAATGYILFDGQRLPLLAPIYTLVPSSIATTICKTATTTTATCSSTSMTKLMDLDYDSSALELPKNIKGNTIVNLKWSIKNNSGSSATSFDAKAIVKLRKWDGSSETEIASGESKVYSGNLTTSQTTTVETTIAFDTPLAHFKKGEDIRLTIEIWGDKTGGETMTFTFNPVATGTTRLMCALPHRLDFM